jgi:hypothetical protein
VNNEEFEKTETVVATLRQAIAEAEKPIYVDSSRFPKDQLDHKPGMVIVEPVHAIDISQERVDETAKDRHEWVGQPDLARVGEVGVWGDKREWVGLHEHELQVLEYNDPSGERLKLAKAVEAKLKEKNT